MINLLWIIPMLTLVGLSKVIDSDDYEIDMEEIHVRKVKLWQ